MSEEHALPVVGAAMPLDLLPKYRDWLIESRRDLEIQDACRPDVLDSDWRSQVRLARDVLDGYQGRLGIHGPFIGLTLAAVDPKVRVLVVERMRQGLEFGAALGASHMVIHSPFMFFGHPQLAHAITAGRTFEFDAARETIEAFLPMAEQAKCTLVIETIQDTHPAPLLALVRSFESAYVRMSLDIGHAFIGHRIGGPTPDQWVCEAGALLGHLHLQDSDGQLDRHWAPGEGNINWYALFEALGELKQRPRLILELRDYAKIPAAAAWLAEHELAR